VQALQLPDKGVVLKGHGFSRADFVADFAGFSLCGTYGVLSHHPQGLKPKGFVGQIWHG